MALTSILVVCTGNVCRSPAAEGFLRRELAARFGATAPSVSSAGTMGWEGSGATPESVRASAERGVDIAGHRARMLTPAQVTDAGLVVAMARDHVDRILATTPDAADKMFTLKELVRLLEELAPAGSPDERIAQAAARRASGGVPPGDDDVADPLGEPLAVYRAMAAELEDRSRRLVAGLAPARAGAPA
ncbi:MAG TPA: low molecular weight phosphatase family protein [Actinomycetota bacterium]